MDALYEPQEDQPTCHTSENASSPAKCLRRVGVEESQCPLQFAMEQLAHAAVSQLVYYADGEHVPRPDLLRDLERWQRLHSLITESICPASRAAQSSPANLCAALALIPEAQFTAQREMLAHCAARGRGDACPLEGRSELSLFDRE